MIMIVMMTDNEYDSDDDNLRLYLLYLPYLLSTILTTIYYILSNIHNYIYNIYYIYNYIHNYMYVHFVSMSKDQMKRIVKEAVKTSAFTYLIQKKER